MDLRTEWIELDSDGARVSGYLAHAAAGDSARRPGVLVIQEVWGVDAHIRDVTERLAAAGYLALAVDLFSHGGKPEALAPERIEQAKTFLDSAPQAAWMDEALREAELAKRGPEEAEAIAETFGTLMTPERPMDQYVADLRAGAAALRAREDCNGRVGSVGFCLGGALSARLAAAEDTLAGAVIFYGMSPPPDTIARVGCPVLGLYGAEDSRVNAGVPAFEAGMRERGKDFQTVFYSGTGHAFFNDTRPSYRADAARDAWALTLAFLREQTGPAATVELDPAAA